jgi:hypothetical protein
VICAAPDRRDQRLVQRGASIVEFTIALPVVLFLFLAAAQAALAFHAKSNLDYAAFQAARSGSLEHASPAAMFAALAKSLVPYFGGGTTTAQLAQKLALVREDFAHGSARIEILSPNSKSFDDYASPELAARFGGGSRVIPNTGIMNMQCPRDRPSCPSDPASNASGQSIQDANLLAVRVTYGIPVAKQVPLVGRFYVSTLKTLGVGRDDAFVVSLLDQDRIPIVARAVVRMSSEAIEGPSVQLSNGTAIGGSAGGTLGGGTSGGAGSSGSQGSPGTGLPAPGDGSRPPGCRQGDPRCDPDCGSRLCCVVPTFPT